MEIKARKKDEVVILNLIGRIDVNSAILIEAVGQCVREGYNDVLCNFEEIDFIDYMGTSVIVIAYKEIINNGGRMKFCCIPAHLREIFAVMGLEKVIEHYPDEELALNNFKEDKVIDHIKKLQLRRRFKRLPIDLKIELKDKKEEEPHCEKVDLINLSAVGGYIFGCKKYKLGDDVILTMKLSQNHEPIQLDAKVVWLSDKQIQPQTHPGIGVEFLNINQKTQEMIVEFIERNISFLPTDE